TSDTSRQARKRVAGSAEPGGCEAAALAECGSTTGQRSWPGAEGVQARQRGPVFPAPQARGLSRRGQTGTGAPPA
ncbi:hypothetical protein, partial [Klebsiella pneumoniae]|uniref:hypothetical protein n=1 Tax=Klebsiella pneumoniae TaxID=573 RepID=UPI001F4A35F4